MSKNMSPSGGMNKTNGPVHGSMGGMAAGEKAKDFAGTFKKLLWYLSKYKITIFFVIIFAVISTIFSIVGPKILGHATTEIFEGIMEKITGTGDGIDFTRIAQIALLLLALYLISFAFSYLQGFIMTGVSMKVTYRLREDIVSKMNRMPLKYFDTTTHGEILSRVTNDIDTLSQTLNQSITQVITSVTSIVGILVMMITISWQMTLIALCIVPVSFLLALGIIKKSQRHFSHQQEYLGHLNGHIEEMYSGHAVMKAFNGEKEALARFDCYNDKLYHASWKSQFLSGMMMPIMNFVSNVGYVGVCILGGYLSINNGLAVGDIQAFIQYVRHFTQPISQISQISNVMQQAMAAAERVFEFLAEEEEIPETTNPIKLRSSESHKNDPAAVSVNGSVEFKHVKFGYNPDKIIVKDFSAKIKPGQKVAIVGPTGAGKTTMVKLLMRFYDVNDGAILIDGHNVKDFTRNDLRSLFGMVLQDTWLYKASIKENIRYGNLSATDEQVEQAARSAQVDHFVRTLPQGYDTVLNEESSNTSQGQKQLLTIARAILSDPKILILDEATSSVDTRTEVLIQKAMSNLMKGRTSFVIAHRLSTIRDADLILAMKDGDIVEQGSHEELIAKRGFYYSLYNSQF